MQYHRLGESDLEVSVIALGTLAMSGRSYGRVYDKDSVAVIQRAIELGINFIDTSDNYGLGHAEEIVGKAIKGRREDVILATKGGTPWDKQGRITFDCSRETITRSVEESLRRLGTDWIDLYQIHFPDLDTPYEETVRVLEQLVQAGKIRYVGLSNFWMEEMGEWLSIDGIVSNQMPYNFLHRDIEQDILPFCRKHGIGMIAYTPLLMGMFAGRITLETEFGEGDHRSSYPQFQREPLRQCLSLIDSLRPIAEERGMTIVQLALSWVVSRSGMTCAIPGAKRPEQVEENAGAGEQLLTQAALDQIDTVLKEAEVETPRSMPMRIVEVHKGTCARLGVLEMGIKLRIPDSVKPGDIVQMDIVTGEIIL